MFDPILNRLYKAARAYYLMKEGDIEIETNMDLVREELIKEEMTAALVAVKLIAEPDEARPIMSGEVGIASLRYHAKRRREWSMAKILADGAFKPGKTILLEPGEKIV